MTRHDARPFDEQYAALRAGRGVAALADWSSVRVTGADRQAFLHNFCTNDVLRLAPAAGCEAFFTNVKGKIIGHGLVWCRKAELVVIGVPGMAPRLIEHLERYVIREDVQLQDATAERAYLLLTGALHDSQLPTITWRLLGAAPCLLVESSPANLPHVRQSLIDRGVSECGWNALETLRIESGTPLLGVDFDERNLPQEVGRDAQAISFTKGCYLGQETVARIDALGHVNQRIAGVRFGGDAPPFAGTELTRGGAAVGRVTSAAWSPRLAAPLALAMVRREHGAPGTALESALGPCEVVALPLDRA